MTSFATSSIRPVLEAYLAGRVKAERVVAEVANRYYGEGGRGRGEGGRVAADRERDRARRAGGGRAGGRRQPAGVPDQSRGAAVSAGVRNTVAPRGGAGTRGRGEGGGGRAGAGWVHRSRAGRDSRRVPL